MFNYLKAVFQDEHNDDGKDLPTDVSEETQDKDAQKIIDEANGTPPKEEDEIELPSDEKPADEDKLFAEKYKTIEDLRKGITGLKSTLPEYVLDGMNDEALEKHYVELRKDFSGDDKKDRKFEEEKVEEKPDDKPDEKKVEVAGLWKSLENDFKTTGKISTEMYDKFDELGIPSDIVDGYADKIHGEQVDFTNKVYEMSGGQDEFKAIKEWSEAGNIHQSELDAIAKMPYDAMLSAMSGIKARFDIAMSKADDKDEEVPKRIVGNTGKTSGGAYTSQEAYMSDVANKKYGQNRAYTEAVDRKFANSKFK